mgnify:CR=1 FL=1
MAAALGPIVFVVVVVGGLDSIPGALVASILIGIVQTFAVALAASLSERALALWRGPALADVAYDDFARPEALRLEELRLVALDLNAAMKE